MGFIDRLKAAASKVAGDFQEVNELYLLGCEVLGRGNPNSPIDRADRIAEGRRELARRAEAVDQQERQRLERRKVEFGKLAIRAYQQSRRMDAQDGRDVQFENEDCRIEVKNGYQGRTDQYTTDVMVIDRHSSSGAGWHVVFDENGNVLHEGWKYKRG